MLAALLAMLWMWRLFGRRLLGFTGDSLGATLLTPTTGERPNLKGISKYTPQDSEAEVNGSPVAY